MVEREDEIIAQAPDFSPLLQRRQGMIVGPCEAAPRRGIFGAFTAGVAKDYVASSSATVLSTAGDASLSVTDPSATAPGQLVNGTFVLPQPLSARALNAANTGSMFGTVSGTPLTLLTYGAPVSNDAVTLEFKQPIAANDALRTGTYSKTLTYTLSTTTP